MYTPEAIEGFADASLKRLQTERLEHVAPSLSSTNVYQKDALFTKLDKITASG